MDLRSQMVHAGPTRPTLEDQIQATLNWDHRNRRRSVTSPRCPQPARPAICCPVYRRLYLPHWSTCHSSNLAEHCWTRNGRRRGPADQHSRLHCPFEDICRSLPRQSCLPLLDYEKAATILIQSHWTLHGSVLGAWPRWLLGVWTKGTRWTCFGRQKYLQNFKVMRVKNYGPAERNRRRGNQQAGPSHRLPSFCVLFQALEASSQKEASLQEVWG